MKYILALAIISPLLAQFDPSSYRGQTVNLSAVPLQALTRVSTFDGSGNETYRCRALAIQPSYTWAVTPATGQGTLTSIVVASNVGTVNITAHGYAVGNLVVVSGSTTSALNGSYKIVTASTNSFTIATSGVSDATYNTSLLKLASTAPSTAAAVWSVEAYTFSGSNNVAYQVATCALGANSQINMKCACTSPSSLFFQ